MRVKEERNRHQGVWKFQNKNTLFLTAEHNNLWFMSISITCWKFVYCFWKVFMYSGRISSNVSKKIISKVNFKCPFLDFFLCQSNTLSTLQ